MNVQKIIDHYKLQKHPEGGSFIENYRCDSENIFEGFSGDRNISTAIYFLLEAGEKSHFHKIKSDELWHFYLGDPLELIEIDNNGKLIKTVIGPNFENGESLQYCVKAGHWFASSSLGKFSFVGCTVAPGFDFQDFEMAKYEDLQTHYPQYQETLKEFCLD